MSVHNELRVGAVWRGVEQRLHNGDTALERELAGITRAVKVGAAEQRLPLGYQCGNNLGQVKVCCPR